MAAVAPPPDSLDPPPSTPPTTATPPPAATTSTPPNPTTPNPTMPSPNPNHVSTPPVVAPPLPPPPVSFAPSFRPLGAPPPPQMPQYGAIRNPGYPMAQPMQPPGVHNVMRPPPTMYAPQPGPYMPQPGAAVPPGMQRYPGPYPMMRPGFHPRPMPPVGVPQIQRPPIFPAIRGAPPMVAPPVRPPAPAVTPADKPPTAVYVGKIAPTVDNDFLRSLLQLCGPVKSWKRTQNPSNGKPVGFGFCEFESAEGILRATRLLNKLSIDGQELVVNINDATKEYLKKHVEEKKKAQEKGREKEDGVGDGTSAVAENESSKDVPDKTDGTEDAGDKDNEENTKKFGIVTDEDSEADKEAAEKMSSMIEEWLKTRPPPPPPPPPPVQPSADISFKHKNGESDVDMTKTDFEEKNDDDTDKRPVHEAEKSETASSPDRRKDRDHDKERREKDKELQRYERERERERVRRDRDKEHKHREVERLYKDHLKEWESREREKEYQRQYEKDREKEKERERRREIMKQEDDSDEEDSRKRRRRSSGTLEERKRRRQREKQEDLADKLKEEEEIAEARRHAIELQRQADEAAAAAAVEESGTHMDVDGDDEKERNAQNKAIVADDDHITSSANGVGDGSHKESNGDETSMAAGQILDIKQNSNAPAKKLGFGLIGSGKRTSVPSVFAEEDDEDNKDKRIRPLVPIDYSTEELQAVDADSSADQPNIVAAAEFAKRILVSNAKEEKLEIEKDRSRRSSDRSSQRDKNRNDEDGARISDERREKMHDRDKDRQDKPKSENKKILDAKQLIDMIPRTKEELFAYDINWAIYEKHELHDRMRPWISKKIIEFLGEEESTLVEYIVSCTKDHVHASKMLELLQSILDVEAEMFVLKMWRMLIFEIKKVEAGLSGRAKA